MGQRSDPDAEPVQRLQQFQVGTDLEAPLEREHQRDPVAFEGLANVVAITTQDDSIWAAFSDSVRRFDHPQRLPQGELWNERVVDVDRQDLKVDTTGTKLRQPVLAEVTGPLLTWPADHQREQVVVGIGDNGVAMKITEHGAEPFDRECRSELIDDPDNVLGAAVGQRHARAAMAVAVHEPTTARTCLGFESYGWSRRA